MVGANVVVKGPPFLPDASGTVGCADKPNCDDMHNCTATCTTFNARDASTLKAQGYNFIRLGVVWAGGQPNGPGPLDPTFQAKLQAILYVFRMALHCTDTDTALHCTMLHSTLQGHPHHYTTFRLPNKIADHFEILITAAY